jgi:membrane dipeptidase
VNRAEPTVDALLPYGMPFEALVNEYTRPVMEEVLAEDRLAADEAFDAMVAEQVRRVRSNPEFGDRLREIYREAGVDVLVHSLGLKDYITVPYNENLRQDLARWQALFDSLDWLHKVTTPEQATRVAERGDVGIILGTQNHGETLFLERTADGPFLEFLHNAGLRMAGLTYANQTHVGSAAMERHDCGLTDRGHEVVRELNERDVIIDLSHAGEQTTLDTIATSEAPVATTHSACKALNGHYRAESDEVLERLADEEGFLGLIAIETFLSPDDKEQGFERFFDHLEYAISVMGIDYVGIGTDWGITTSPQLPRELHPGVNQRMFPALGFDVEEHNLPIGQGFGPMTKWTDWHVIPDSLAERGYNESEIDKIVGGNFMDFWRRVVS